MRVLSLPVLLSYARVQTRDSQHPNSLSPPQPPSVYFPPWGWEHTAHLLSYVSLRRFDLGEKLWRRKPRDTLPTVSLTTLGSPGKTSMPSDWSLYNWQAPSYDEDTQTLMCPLLQLKMTIINAFLCVFQSQSLDKPKYSHSHYALGFQDLLGRVPLIWTAGASPAHPGLFLSSHSRLSYTPSHPPPPLAQEPVYSLRPNTHGDSK